jgi:type IV pilus assembly protein PilZ
VTAGANGVKAQSVREPPDPPDESERPPGGAERRCAERVDVVWSVDCETDSTFLYASITNISELGIFVATSQPLEVGTRLTLRFSPPGAQEPFVLAGQVQWVNPVKVLAENLNPGMGIRFIELGADDRERIVDAIHTIAYVRDVATN